MPKNHKSLVRMFVNCPIGDNELIDLERNQSNHLIKILRKKINDELIIFNGNNGAYLAKIINENKKSTKILALEQISAQPKPNDIWYGFAPLKTARLDYMVQKATEMGVSTMQPVFTQYTQVKNIKTDRIKANIIEAAQQCEILNIPKLAPNIKLLELIANWENEHKNRKLIFADENMAAGSPVKSLEKLKGQPVGLLIGPEGGFCDQEREIILAKPFVVPISLGANILRSDTAAVAALALIQLYSD